MDQREESLSVSSQKWSSANYWKTTGSIFFQGPELSATELKVAIFKRAIMIKQFDESGGEH